MKRLLIAAVAGLCAAAPVGAQDGGLAPTSPVVPPPVLHNGGLVATGNSWGQGPPRLFTGNNWSPLRSPVVAGDPSAAYTVPPLTGAACGPAGCAPAGRDRSCLAQLKAWICFHDSRNPLPKHQPAPYVYPLQGMFGCTSGAGCASGGCATAGGVYPQAPGGYQPAPQTMPMNPPIPPAAGAVLLPSRGAQGLALQPTWQGRVTPMQAETGVAGYRLPALENAAAQKPAAAQPGPIVNTGGFVRPGQK